MAYQSGINQVAGGIRGQNIGKLEGEKGRILTQQIADQQAQLNREALSQNQSQFDARLEYDEAARQAAAEQAASDRLYGLIGSGIGGVLGAGGTVLGAGLGKEGFLNKG